jgi:hypothetical protein
MTEFNACFNSLVRSALLVMNEPSKMPLLNETETKFLKFLSGGIKPVSLAEACKQIALPITLTDAQILKDKGLLEFAPIKPYEKSVGENVGFCITPEGRETINNL